MRGAADRSRPTFSKISSHQLRVRASTNCVCVALVYSATAAPGSSPQRRCSSYSGRLSQPAPVSVQLVQAVEAEELYARKLVEPVWRNARPDFGHGSFGARVAITERVIQRPAVAS